MLKIALTGNIASGKTFALELLKKWGVETLCLDEVTSEIYDDPEIKKTLLKEFQTDKKEELSKIVFKNRQKLKQLEQILYPKIKDSMFDFFNKNIDKKYTVCAAPQLFEAGFEKYFDKIILITSSENIRLERLKKRNNLSNSEAWIRINSQMKEEDKISRSNYIIENNAGIKSFETAVLNLKKELDTL